MHHFFDAITSTNGDSLPGYFARAINTVTQAAVALASDESGTPIIAASGVANMARSDAFGNISFYVEPGKYHLDIYQPDTTTFVYRVSNVSMTSTKGDKGDEGDAGAPGPSNNTRLTLAALKAANITDRTSLYAGKLWTWTEGDFSAVPASLLDRQIVKANSTALSVGAWLKDDGPLYATSYGCRGDGATDDTAAIQAFLNLCEALGGRAAHFGALRYRTTGPLVANRVAVVFDPVQYLCGFVPEGSGYVALTMTGESVGSNISVIGHGVVTFAGDGSVMTDTRPQLTGVAFGRPDGSAPFASSTVDSVRVFGLAGAGAVNTTVWDSTFSAVSVQECGTPAVAAFQVTATNGTTCNETKWTRLQVEECVGRAIDIHPSTLNCAIGLIHSERAKAITGSVTWAFGGTGIELGSVRLEADVPARASASFTSDNMTVTNLRPEGEFPCWVNAAASGSIVFQNPTANAQLTAAPGGAGKVTVVGGTYSAMDVRAGWTLLGGDVVNLRPGNMTADQLVDVVGARVRDLRSSTISTNGNVQLTATNVDAITVAGLARVWLTGSSRAVVAGGTAAWENMTLGVDATSTLVAVRLTLNRVGARFSGQFIGDLEHGVINSVLFGQTAEVRGTIINHGPPVDGLYLDGLSEGMSCKNMRPVIEGTAGSRDFIAEWRRIGAVFEPARVKTGT